MTMAYKNIAGQKFGRLTAIKRSGSINGRAAWEFQCDCGETITTDGKRVRSGNTKSCGCIKNTVDGLSKTATYQTWVNMINRCTKPSCDKYKFYGERGITVDSNWMDYRNFLHDMGEKPQGLTLERIDNEKGYGPGNCKWDTRINQANNRRNNKFVEYKGEKQTVAQWAKVLGINCFTLYTRLSSGHSIADSFSKISLKQRS